MALKVLGISSSPRCGGNSDALLREALAGAGAAGANVEYLSLRGLSLSPCVECNSCARTGLCRIDDDFQPVFARMVDADRLIFATPVFFMAVCSQGKLLIDRCQCLWARKYILKKPLYDEPRDRRAMVIAVGGSRSRKMFDAVGLTMKYWFDALEMHWASNLYVNGVDEAGSVKQHPLALQEARRLGAALVAAGPPPAKPETVGIFTDAPSLPAGEGGRRPGER